MTALLVALAGAAGAVARFLVDGAMSFRRTTNFPWSTFVINVSGSFALGALTGAVTAAATGSAGMWAQVGGVGFCGGYTTFSTASFATVRLVQRGRGRAAVAFAVGGLLASVAAAAVGWSLTQ